MVVARRLGAQLQPPTLYLEFSGENGHLFHHRIALHPESFLLTVSKVLKLMQQQQLQPQRSGEGLPAAVVAAPPSPDLLLERGRPRPLFAKPLLSSASAVSAVLPLASSSGGVGGGGGPSTASASAFDFGDAGSPPIFDKRRPGAGAGAAGGARSDAGPLTLSALERPGAASGGLTPPDATSTPPRAHAPLHPRDLAEGAAHSPPQRAHHQPIAHHAATGSGGAHQLAQRQMQAQAAQSGGGGSAAASSVGAAVGAAAGSAAAAAPLSVSLSASTRATARATPLPDSSGAGNSRPRIDADGSGTDDAAAVAVSRAGSSVSPSASTLAGAAGAPNAAAGTAGAASVSATTEAARLAIASIGDLQRAGPASLQAAKARMDLVFDANRLKPSDAAYVYDRRVEFTAPTEASDWD